MTTAVVLRQGPDGKARPVVSATRANELRESRIHNKLAVERIRAVNLANVEKRLGKQSLMESTMLFDWVTPYSDMLDRMRRTEPFMFGPSAVWNRRWGRNYPIFQSENELNLIRAPARILCCTNSYAIGLMEALTSYVVGLGFTHTAQAKETAWDCPPDLPGAVQVVIDRFHERNQWFGGELPSLEEELFWRSREDGEFFLMHFPDWQTGDVDVRTSEPEQITAKPGSDPREWMFGIHTDPDDTQNPNAYWVYWGENPSDGEEVDCEWMTHYRANSKRSIKRGLTDFCFDSLDTFTFASRLRNNLADAAAQQAAIVGITQYDSGKAEDITAALTGDLNASDYQQTDPLTGVLENVKRYRGGEWEHIPKGQQYVAGPTAQSQPIHLQVLDACLQGAGVRWNAPDWTVAGKSSQMAAYTASMVAESPFVKTGTRKQKTYGEAYKRSDWIAVRVWCDVHGGIYAAGRMYSYDEVRKLIDINVEGHTLETRNKLEESQRAAIEIPLGTDSRQRYAASQDRDFDQISQDNEDYQAQTGGAGTGLPLPGDDAKLELPGQQLTPDKKKPGAALESREGKKGRPF